MAGKVLIVVHQENSTPGRVGELLEARGYALDRRCPNLGDPLPPTLEGHAAAVVFGGPMSANDDHLDGIRAELTWLETVIPSERPLLGICLGAQLIARTLGARVGPHPGGLVEIGYHEVQPTGTDRSFLGEPTVFYQWHRETFELPEGSLHLAANEAFPNQAFRYDGKVYGLEFHPEMTKTMVERWSGSEKGSQQLVLPGAQPRAEQLLNFDRFAPASDRWLERFLDHHLLA